MLPDGGVDDSRSRLKPEILVAGAYGSWPMLRELWCPRA